MDERPFLLLDLENLDENSVSEVSRFASTQFDLDSILGTAANLKYQAALRSEILNEISDPSEEIVRLLCKRVYEGSVTQQFKNQFTILVKRAFGDVVRGKVEARIKTALDSGAPDYDKTGADKQAQITPDATMEANADGIETTEDEIFAHSIIKAIAAEITDPERISMRDARSYCAILFDNNNRKPIVKLRLGKRSSSISFIENKTEVRESVKKVPDIFKHKSKIQHILPQYLKEDQDY